MRQLPWVCLSAPSLAGKSGLALPIRVGSHSARGCRGANAPFLRPLVTRPSMSTPVAPRRLPIALRRSFSAARFARGRFAKLKGIKYVWRQQLSEATPAWARSVLWRAACRFDMLVLDHGVFRLAYLNQHRLGEHAWRSGQPAPPTISMGLHAAACARSSTFVASAFVAATCWRG
jgi:hypothetical protein